MAFYVKSNVIFLSINTKMCNTCYQGQVKFTTPITLVELERISSIRKCVGNCAECGELAFAISKFQVPSLISNWKLLMPTSEPYVSVDNVVYTFTRMIV
jgi:hypothetical protein